MVSAAKNYEIHGIYFLSGDLHAANAIEVGLKGRNGGEIKVWEFCSTPFEQQPNRLARFTRLPIRSHWISRQECHFIISENNFGVVTVDISQPDPPQVGFQVIGEGGKLLGEAGSH